MTEPEPGAAMLEQIAALGPFFAVQSHNVPSPAPPWRPMRELVQAPAILRERVARVRAHLAAGGGRPPEAVELRVAASVTHLGLTARLVSPVLALAAVHGVLLPPDLDGVHWQPALGGAFPLSLPREHLRTGCPPPTDRAAAARWAAALVAGPLHDLVRATRALSVSPRVLWGNVASAVNGAATAIAAAAPARTGRAQDLLALLQEQPSLHGTGTRTAGTAQFRRRSCCLIYRVTPKAAAAVCGDCVLARR